MCDILIVEDDDDIREDLANILKDEGFSVVTAAGGEAALEHLRGPDRPGVILLDLMMPHMNGWDFRIHQLEDARIADIPVVVLSGAANLVPSAGALKAATFLVKPFRLADLLETIALLLVQPTEGAAPQVTPP